MTVEPAADDPDRLPVLGARGRRLWVELAADGTQLKPAERVLVEEICRSADRLDRLDAILRGDEGAWMRFRAVNEDGSVVQVVLNNVLSESRAQQVALKQMLGELRQSRSGGVAPKTSGARPPAKEAAGDDGAGASGVVSFAARLAAKRGGPAAG